MSQYQNKKGFTITEVIVSALIIGVLAAGVFGAFFGAQRLLNQGRHRMQAYNFAVEALDRLRSNYKYTDSQMTLTTTASDADDHLESEIVPITIPPTLILRGGEFLSLINHTLKYDVIDTGFADDGYKQVIIKVHWDEPAF